ncbi:iron ABC transporter permease [Candidatus Sumerlaeota bacterium]|nr:iron ABC transporter permease [Candidatus Sumerlaeota bacterium]
MAMNPQSARLRLYDPRLILLFAVLLGYVLWPILQVLIESVWSAERGVSLEPWRQFVEKGHWFYGVRSIAVSLATVLLAGIFGTALAFFYFRLDFPGRGVFAGLSLLPFTLPPLVGVFAIWTLMAEDGLFHQLTRTIFGRGFWFEKGYGGVLLIHVYSMYVYFFVMAGGAISNFDESQIEAARDLGAGRSAVFFRVLLPQLAPALVGASLLTFMTSMASFTAPYFYMAGRPVLTVGIQQALQDSQSALASVDCVALAICAGIFLVLNMRFERAFEGGVKGVARRRAQIQSPALRWLAACAAFLLTLALLSPHLSMLREAFIKPGTGFIGRPIEYTTDNFAKLLRDEEAWHPISVSLVASALATGAVLLFGLTSAWLDARKRFAGKGFMRWLVMLPWAMPGTVIGIGLLWITRTPNLLTWGLALRGTIAILALAYFLRLLPLGHRTIMGGLLRVSPELEFAARDLGATPMQVLLRITIPLILSAILAAATLTFVTAMGEFVSSILLQGPGTEAISVKIDQIRRGPAGMQMAAAYGALLTLMITLTFILFGKRSRYAY